MSKNTATQSSDTAPDLKQEVQAAAITAARITGWAGLDRPALVAKFRSRAPRSTLYRWLKEIDGAPLNRSVPEMAHDACQGSRSLAESVAHEIRGRAQISFPTPPSIEECLAAVTPRHIIENLTMLLAASSDVMAQCRTREGEVRNSKMLLRAAEQLRKSLETAVKLQEAITDSFQIETFHKTVIDEISTIDPQVARRIVMRLDKLNIAWSSDREN